MERTKLFRLLTVPTAAPVKPSSKWLSPLRALASLFVWVVVFGLSSLTPLPSYAATDCGGNGQRACCLGERIPSCNVGFIEIPGCSGNCTCGGVNPFGVANSIGHCIPLPGVSQQSATPCGAAGQRACCVTERVPPSCNLPLIEIPGCSGNCTCGGANPGGALNSLGHCAPLPGTSQQPSTPCGANGQRACCVTERLPPSCNLPLIELPGCTGNCTCGGPNPGGLVKALGHCAPLPFVTPQQPATPQQPSNSCSAAMANLNSAIAAISAANQAVQQQCAQAGGAQQVVPTMKQNVGGPGGLPAKSVAPGGLQRPVAPSGLQRPVMK